MDMTSLTSLRDQIKSLREQTKIECVRVFKEGFNEIFTQFPVLHSVSWTAYTPYFNDGDVCVFESNHEDFELEILVNNEVRQLEYEDTHEYKFLIDTVGKFLAQFENEDYQAMFGDGVLVRVTRDGTTTEEYDHD